MGFQNTYCILQGYCVVGLGPQRKWTEVGFAPPLLCMAELKEEDCASRVRPTGPTERPPIRHSQGPWGGGLPSAAPALWDPLLRTAHTKFGGPGTARWEEWGGDWVHELLPVWTVGWNRGRVFQGPAQATL